MIQERRNDVVYEISLVKGQPIKGSEQGKMLETFVGAIDFGELVNRYRIPHLDYATDKGYQRKPSSSRVNSLARDLSAGMVDLPTAVLLSVRVKDLSPRRDKYGHYTLAIPDNSRRPFYVIDGQHRLEALKKLINDEKQSREKWHTFKIPTVIIFGADENTEMDQFHTVNSNAKSISTDLALALLRQRAKDNKAFRKYLVEKGQEWKVHGQELMELVAELEMWKDKIRFPNQPKGRTLVRSNTFVRSLKPCLEQANFGDYAIEEQAIIINAYWEGIGKVLPECFFSPNDYNIQGGIGVNVLHFLLPTALFYANKLGGDEGSSETFYRIYEATLLELSGENRANGEAVGYNFWRVGAEGASGAFSSHPGQRVLRDRIRRMLMANLKDEEVW